MCDGFIILNSFTTIHLKAVSPFRYITLFIFLLVFFSSNSQQLSDRYLNNLHDEELLELFNELNNDSLAQERVARIYLNRARKEKDTIKMARGYDRLARIYNPKKNIQFADSVIKLTKKLNNITYPSAGYMIKGYEYYILGNLVLSTENFLKSYDYAVKNMNIQQQVFLLDYLIFYKSTWGNKYEALNLQKRRHEIILAPNYIDVVKKASREGVTLNYYDLSLKDRIYSFLNFSYCYRQLKELDSSLLYLNKARQAFRIYNGSDKNLIKSSILNYSMETFFHRKQFRRTLKVIDTVLNSFRSNQSSYSLMNLNLYKGLSLINLDNYEEGIQLLIKSDSIFENSINRSQPFDRILFEKLNQYYKSRNDIKNRIKYLNKMLLVDSIFKINYQYFEPKFIRNYETPKLLSEKEELILSLKEENTAFNTLIWAFSLMLLLSLIGLLYYFKRQLLFKKRFEEIMEKRRSENSIKGQDKVKTNKISSEIINSILDQLDTFEAKKDYLSQEVSLNDLAKKFNTNPNYLSQIINIEKEKNFSQYINDLRLEFAFQKLADDDIFRRYTIIAIANDSGFKRAESFSRAFYKKYRLYPSFYIKKLNRS